MMKEIMTGVITGIITMIMGYTKAGTKTIMENIRAGTKIIKEMAESMGKKSPGFIRGFLYSIANSIYIHPGTNGCK